MRGDDAPRAAALREQPRGAPVRVPALDRRQPLGDRRPDQRVTEAQQRVVLEQVGSDELGRRGARRFLPHAREARRDRELGAVAEHRHRRRQRRPRRPETGEPQRDAPRE